MDEQRLQGSDGVDLFYRRWRVAGAPAAVVIAHGMSEHSGRYDRLATAINEQGWSAYAPDHRGHGRTAASTGVGKAGASGMDGILSDLDALVDVARRETGADRVVLLGHSMGSMLSQAWAERYGDKLIGLALSGSPGVPEAVAELAAGLTAAVDAGMADEPLDTLAGFNGAFEPARTPFDWLSRDDAEVDAYVADPLCGSEMPMTYGFVAGLLEMTADAMTPEGLGRIPTRVPVLLLTGEADPVSDGGKGVRELEARMRAAGLDVTALYYPDARHEVFNETNRDEVTGDLLAWMGKILA